MDKCSCTVHRMKPTDNGEWDYVQQKTTKAAKTPANDINEEPDDLWEDTVEGELGDMDPVVTSFTVPLINGETATIKRLTNKKIVKNLGLQVRPVRQSALQLGEHNDKWKNGPENSKKGYLPARAMWQSYIQQLWSSMKYGLWACSATLRELENGLGLTDFYLISKLGVA